jgi:hypothetical protein
LFTAIGLTPGGNSAIHISKQTIQRTTQLTNWEECGLCPVFATYTLAYALKLRKKHGKTPKKSHGKTSGKSTEQLAATTTDIPLKLIRPS